MDKVDIFEKINDMKFRVVSKVMEYEELFKDLAKVSMEIQEIHLRWFSPICVYSPKLGLHFYVDQVTVSDMNQVLLKYESAIMPICYYGNKKLWIIMEFEEYNLVRDDLMKSNKFTYDTNKECWTSPLNIYEFSSIMPYAQIIKSVLAEDYVIPNLPIDDKNIMPAINFIMNTAMSEVQTYDLYNAYLDYMQDLCSDNMDIQPIISFRMFFDILSRNGKVRPPHKEHYIWSPSNL